VKCNFEPDVSIFSPSEPWGLIFYIQIFVEIRGWSLVLTWCCGWPWRLDTTETPELAELRPNPRSAKCIYDGISLHMYFASTRILKGTEPLAFLLNCLVVVETKGEMQFRAKCVNFFSPSEPWALIIYTQTGSSSVRTFHGIVVEALDSNACVVGSSPSWSPGVRSSLVPEVRVHGWGRL